MITFQQARAIAAAEYLKQDHDFEPWVADWGYENADYFQVICGDKLWLVDEIDLAPVDDLMRLVSKTTGEYLEVSALQILDELDGFTAVGDVPTYFQ